MNKYQKEILRRVRSFKYDKELLAFLDKIYEVGFEQGILKAKSDKNKNEKERKKTKNK